MWWSKKKEAQVPTVSDVTTELRKDSWFLCMLEEKAEHKVKKFMENLVVYFEKAYKEYAPELHRYHGDDNDKAISGMASFGRYVDMKIEQSYRELVQRDLNNRVQVEVDKIVGELKGYLNTEKLLDDIVKRLKNKQLPG